jgi:hypothetical protein
MKYAVMLRSAGAYAVANKNYAYTINTGFYMKVHCPKEKERFLD